MTLTSWMNRIAVLAFAAVLLVPQSALACSVCFSAKEGTQMAFIVTTVFLSLLPLGLIGGLIYWLRSKAKSLAAAEGHASTAN
jgi:hypothetical protein